MPCLGQSLMHAGDTIDRLIDITFAVATGTDLSTYAGIGRAQRLAGRTLEGFMRTSLVPASSPA